MNFKTEVCLLTLAVTLFVISAFFFSYQTENPTFLNLANYPYRVYALAFVGFGSLLTLTASISYSKRSKNIMQ
jgi:hypothetical protein